MRTTSCAAFRQFDKAAANLAADKEAAQRFEAFRTEEADRLLAAGASIEDAVDIAINL